MTRADENSDRREQSGPERMSGIGLRREFPPLGKGGREVERSGAALEEDGGGFDRETRR